MTSSIRSTARVLATALVLTSGAQAAASPNLEAAEVAVDAAQRAYELGRFEDASIAYTSAYELCGLPALLFNLAQTHRQLKHYERAAFFYGRYLELQPPPVENEALTRSLLKEMEEAAAAHQPSPDLETTAALARVLLKVLETSSVPAQALPASPTPAPPEGPRVQPSTPLIKQWWLWTVVGVVVTGGAVAAGMIVTQGHPAPTQTSLGEIHF
ncbi:MAG TPA: tetratricopeptide repeat protein [Myxococcales bacterium]|jgi:hypothetical protein